VAQKDMQLFHPTKKHLVNSRVLTAHLENKSKKRCST
jgi:hypothetical protein